MKKILSTIFITLSMSVSSLAYSEVNIELDDACKFDPMLIDPIVEIIQAGSSVDGDLSVQEVDQIKTILNEDANQEGSIREKLAAVLQACAEGRIFQKRNSGLINSQ